jgi:putative membrane protein insertion efficiency factor
MTSVRGVLWRAGAPARLVLLGAISLYRLTLSGWLGGQCRFSPTCSRYAEEAIRTHGAVKGSFLMVRRVLRCNPFGRGGLDPVPRAHWHDAAHDSARDASRVPLRLLSYDDAIRRIGGER